MNNNDIQLTEHFKLSEFTNSETARKAGIRNVPGDTEIESLRNLCQQVLEPLRAHFGTAITISSGYRSSLLNQAVGGVRDSQHITGEAADIPYVSGWAEWIACNTTFDQLIIERKGQVRWIHVSCKRDVSANRHQVLKADQGDRYTDPRSESHRLLISFAVIALVLLTGCTTARNSATLPAAIQATRDTVRATDIRYDSVLIYRDRFQDRTTDTVYLRETNQEYRYKLYHDTVRIVTHDSIPYPVTVIKEVPRQRTTLDKISYLCMYLVILTVAILIARKRTARLM